MSGQLAVGLFNSWSKTHGLHDVLEGVETNITGRALDLRIHRHGQALQGGRDDKRPFPAEQGQLDGEEGDDGSDHSG